MRQHRGRAYQCGGLIAAANFSQELGINPLELQDNGSMLQLPTGSSNLKLDTGTLTGKDIGNKVKAF